MKNSFHKVLTKILFCAMMMGTSSKAHAWWFPFPEPSSLNEEQQKALIHSCLGNFVSKFHHFAQDLQGNLLQQFLSQCRGGLTLGDMFYRHLLNKDSKQANLENVLSAIDADMVMYRFETNDPNNDGLVNVVICKTVKSFAGLWSQEQLEEAFETLWSSFTTPITLTAIPHEAMEGLLDQYPDIMQHCDGLLLAEGENLCEKIANHFSASLISCISEQGDGCGCLACIRTCFHIGKTYIAPAAMGILKVIEIVSQL
ncbi:MAG: hypothetical protein LBF43_03395 [Puniceicoccales bacterium]|jgi:hypothetical protein|nr:hypothetical protein [Puniceicoccales bacterium]